MAKETPEKYEPGELKNIRKKLGALTRDEAGKMTKILGGEIGKERTDQKIEKKYKRIKNLAKRSSDHIADGKNREQRKSTSTGATKKSERFKNKKYAYEQRHLEQRPSEKNPIGQLKYFDRLKYNFMCQRHPAKLKTLSQAVLSIFSFLIKTPDYINPLFIENTDILFVKSIEELVLSVRSLLSSPNRIVIQEIARNSFYNNILTTLKDWDLVGIRKEISKLQKGGRKIEIAKLKKLCLMVCRPLVILMNLNSQTHILPAIKRAYDVNMVFAQEQGAVKELIIRNSFSTARKKLLTVSTEVKRNFYPILLRLSSNRFISFEDFFAGNFQGIISLLNLSEEDILKPEVGKIKLSPPKLKAALDKADKADKERPDTSGPEKERDEKEGTEKATIPERAKRGMMFLELLFPGAGWEKLVEFPDLFSYFQPLFKYPPGFELISNRDPMQQIIILLSILDYLFAGFRNINFGVLQTSGEELRPPIQGIFNNLIQTWPLFLNEIISGLYIPRLQDYCSQIEQKSSFEISDSARKIEEQVNWLKRAYFLPFYSFKQRYADVNTGVARKDTPRLYETLATLKILLSRVALEIDRSVKADKARKTARLDKITCKIINNPWEQIRFDIENPLSRRLRLVLTEKSKDPTGKIKIMDKFKNANLIFYTLMVIDLLDYLINNRNSFLYEAPGKILFRSAKERIEIKEYSHELQQTYKINNEAADSLLHLKSNFQAHKENRPVDLNSELLSSDSLQEKLARQIEQCWKLGKSFSILEIDLAVKQYDSNVNSGERFIALLQGLIRNFFDILFMMDSNHAVIVLPDTDLEKALKLGRRILSATEGMRKEINPAIAVVQYQSNWSRDRLLAISRKVLKGAKDHGGWSLSYLSPVTNLVEIAEF